MIRTRVPKERLQRVGRVLRPLGILVSLFATTPSIAQPGDDMAGPAQITRQEKELLDYNPSNLAVIFEQIQNKTLKQNDVPNQREFLTRIQTILNKDNPTPGEMQIQEKFGPHARKIGAIQGLLLVYQEPVAGAQKLPEEKWEGEVVPVKLPPTHIDVPVPNYEIFTGTEGKDYVATNLESSDELIGLFRSPDYTGEEQGQFAADVTSDYIQARRSYSNQSNDEIDDELAARDLGSSLRRIPKGNQIWGNQAFADAVERLERGDLDAIESLNAIPELSNFLNTVVNSYTFQVDQRSFRVVTTSATVEFMIDEENQKAWKKVLTEEGALSARFLGLFLNATYSLLEPRGRLTKTVIEDGRFKEELVKQVTGEGHSISGTVGGTVAGVSTIGETEIPYMIRVSTEIGFHTSKFKYAIEDPTKGTQQKEITIEQPYLGAHGIEIQFPGKEGKRDIIRLERAGIYHLSADFTSNYLFYVTASVTPVESESFRLSFQATPQINWLFSQLKAGTAADIIAEFFNSSNNRLAARVGVDYKRNIDTDTNEVTLRIGTDIGLTESFSFGVTAEKGFGEGYSPINSSGWSGNLSLKFTF